MSGVVPKILCANGSICILLLFARVAMGLRDSANQQMKTRIQSNEKHVKHVSRREFLFFVVSKGLAAKIDLSAPGGASS